MRTFYLTESGERDRLSYVLDGLSAAMTAANVTAEFFPKDRFRKLRLEVPKAYEAFFLSELKEKLAEIIVVGYKYDFFAEKVRLSGLSDVEKELFLTAVIAADLDDDKKYALRFLDLAEETSVDGVYHFRLQKLKEKWAEIAAMLPSYFGAELYHNFMQYLIDDFRQEPVYVVGEQVFDGRYNRKTPGVLSGEESALCCAKNILLSGGKEIHLVGDPAPATGEFLSEFYGTNVFFHCGKEGLYV